MPRKPHPKFDPSLPPWVYVRLQRGETVFHPETGEKLELASEDDLPPGAPRLHDPPDV